jgi:hypothetical protein
MYSGFDQLFDEAAAAFGDAIATQDAYAALQLQDAAVDYAIFQSDQQVQYAERRVANQKFVLADQIAAQEVQDLGDEIIGYAQNYNLPEVAERVYQFRQDIRAAEIEGFTGA